ncbi:MAG: tyrosine--tRNA ligase [Phycisphaerales bacterium]|jgi:tyrosyl-tRNA synthetase|nr:tyrosine--tRNA ligase [Phycisphaerales bacterium]
MPHEPFNSLIDELAFRGLLHQTTGEDALRTHLAEPAARPVRAYCGFDPTADSLTIGNLVPIMLLVHLARWGHEPVVLMGGGTGLIGDPSGKSAERSLRTTAEVEGNVRAQRPIFERVFAHAEQMSGGAGGLPGGKAMRTPPIVNNADWLARLGYIEVLRDVGKHFSINEMIKRDSVRDRLENREQGISYTEFSYMILQAYDFLHLFENFARHGIAGPVTLQVGGSDQWGNMVAGIELIRRVSAQIWHDAVFYFGAFGADWYSEDREAGKTNARASYDRLTSIAQLASGGLLSPKGFNEFLGVSSFQEELFDQYMRESPDIKLWNSYAHVLTAPLVTKADGGKFGKTETGAIWLTPERTSPYDFYQFWLNAQDADAQKWIALFTILPREEVESLRAQHEKDPGARTLQRTLARHMTTLIHGPEACAQAEDAAKALFSGDLRSLSREALEQSLSEAPHTEHDRADLSAGIALVDLLPQTSLATSKREAREFLQAGAVRVNGEVRQGIDARVTPDDLLHGSIIVLKRGKKLQHVTRWA